MLEAKVLGDPLAHGALAGAGRPEDDRAQEFGSHCLLEEWGGHTGNPDSGLGEAPGTLFLRPPPLTASARSGTRWLSLQGKERLLRQPLPSARRPAAGRRSAAPRCTSPPSARPRPRARTGPRTPPLAGSASGAQRSAGQSHLGPTSIPPSISFPTSVRGRGRASDARPTPCARPLPPQAPCRG